MSDKPDLLVIGPVTDRMMSRLTERFSVHVLFDQPDRDAFLQAEGARFTAVATDGHYGLSPAPADLLPNLRIVSSYGVGYDAIDAVGLAAKGVIVSHTPDVLNDEVADTAILLWLAVSRRLVSADQWARSGKWVTDGVFPLTKTVQNRTVGILGFGRIGQTIAARAAMFNANVLYHARSPKDVPETYVSDPVELARKSDVLICITPGGPSTRHLVNSDVLRALGADGILVNISRGSVVDEAALVEALRSGELGGAGLDVFEDEPNIPDPLKTMDNVVLTPHVGSATVETRQAMGDLTCDNLIRFLDEGRVLTPVPECRGLNE